jgi:hypothetical protein
MITRLCRTLLPSIILVTISFSTAAAHAGSCDGPYQTGCNGAVNANSSAGTFHGLLAVTGDPWVLNRAAGSGTQPGCGDCTWTLNRLCTTNTTGDPTTDACTTRRGTCHKRQTAYLLYLSTDTTTDIPEGTLCLGGTHHPIAIGDHASTDVQRYLHTITPPPLTITTRPAHATLTGLPTYFTAHPPTNLHPQPFGGPQITETITITPTHTNWHFRGSTTTPTTTKTPTPNAAPTYTFTRPGTAHGDLTTTWGATYTITYAGSTYGPYTATGTLTAQQQFTLPIHTTTPTLVSH